jgi:D-alanyl-D-alanine carboxypeptidase
MTFVDEQLKAIVSTGVPGVAVVGVGVEAAAGVADVRTGEPLTVDHRFRIGSVTKIFVAALVLQLVADGMLELDAPADPFVEDVTLRQLLNHTSGLDDFDAGPEFWEPYRRDPAHRWELGAHEELALALAKPRLFAPGEGWAYHGSNYTVVRLLVEKATGISLRDALRQRVLDPLGLARTDLVEESLDGDCARAYIDGDNPILPGDGLVDVTALDLPFYRAGGGVVSTPAEVALLMRALLGGEFLPTELRAQMLDAVESDWPETDRYGLGIGEITSLMRGERSPCGSAWGHLGFSLGYVAVALSSEDGERQVVLCTNGQPITEETESAFFEFAGRLMWNLLCG